MTGTDGALVALAVASALHLGFQLTVTMVVYPALARVDDAAWSAAHARHSRAILPVVVITYGAVVLSWSWLVHALVGDGGAGLGAAAPWVWLSAAGALLALLTTVLVAAPTHARLARGREQPLVEQLLRAERVRAAGALLSCAAAVVAVGTAAS